MKNEKDSIQTLQILLNTIDKEIDYLKPQTTTRVYSYIRILKDLKTTVSRLIDLELDSINGVNNHRRKNRLRRKMTRQLDEAEDKRQLVKYLSLK